MQTAGRTAEWRQAGERPWKGLIAASLVFLLVANLFAWTFVSQERAIYCWDFSNHWVRTIRLAEALRQRPAAVLREVVWTVRHMEYNDLAALLLVPWAWLWGTSRTAFILSIVNGFAFPAALTGAWLFWRVVRRAHPQVSAAYWLVPIACVLGFPFFWTPILNGYGHVAGLVPIHAMLALFAATPLEAQRARHVVACALVSAGLVLFHKWYAYWVVGLFAALAVDWLAFARARERGRHALRLAALAALTALFFFGLAWPLARIFLSTNYRDAFTAYVVSPTLAHRVVRVLRYIGPFYLGLFLAGLWVGCRRGSTRRLTIMLAVQWVVILLAYTWTTDMHTHQFYMLQPAMLLALSLAVAEVLRSSWPRWARGLGVSGLVCFAALSMVCVFSPACARVAEDLRAFLPAWTHYPRGRHDLAEVERLVDTLAALADEPDEYVYVVASSAVLNSDVVKHARLSLNRPPTFEDRVVMGKGVDKWQGFPSGFFHCKYVVVGEPIQYHLRPEDQRVVGVLAEALLERKNVGTSFERLPFEFTLDGGVKVWIYERTRPFRGADLRALSEIMRGYYPDRPRLYEIQCPPELIDASGSSLAQGVSGS